MKTMCFLFVCLTVTLIAQEVFAPGDMKKVAVNAYLCGRIQGMGEVAERMGQEKALQIARETWGEAHCDDIAKLVGIGRKP